MKVLVVSGFLGAGKTTFIKELITKTKKPLVVLENEYGETDLDKSELSAEDKGLQIMEFMEGCVCCSQKDTFANSLITIQASLDPEYLVVEPTGVGKLGNILENINRVVWDKIRPLKPIVIVSPASFFGDIREYREIYEDQIKNAGYIIYSKIENMDREELQPVSRHIRELNPNAVIWDEPYKGIEEGRFLHLLEDGEDGEEGCFAGAVNGGQEPYFRLQAKPLPERGDDDILDQYTIKDICLRSEADLLLLLEGLIRGRLGSIPRAKGAVPCGENWCRFDVASGMYSITGCDYETDFAQCVFIGRDIARSAIDGYFEMGERKPAPQNSASAKKIMKRSKSRV